MHPSTTPSQLPARSSISTHSTNKHDTRLELVNLLDARHSHTMSRVAVDDLPLQRRPTNSRVYGKKARQSSTPVRAAATPLASEVNSSSEDEMVTTSLKTKRQPAVPSTSKPSPSKKDASPSVWRAQTAPTFESPVTASASSSKVLAGSVVSAMAGRKVKGATSPAATRLEPKATEWNEQVASTTKSVPRASTSSTVQPNTSGRAQPPHSTTSSPLSPSKRPQSAIASTSTTPNPVLSKSSSTPPPSSSKVSAPATTTVSSPPKPASSTKADAVAALNEPAPMIVDYPDPPSPPRRKRARTKPDPPTAAPSTIVTAPTPARRAATAGERSLPPPTKPSTDRDLPQPSPPKRQKKSATPVPNPRPSSPNRRSPSPAKSPIKDLSKLFEKFVPAAEEKSGSEKGARGKMMSRSGSGVIASLGTRTSVSADAAKSPGA